MKGSDQPVIFLNQEGIEQLFLQHLQSPWLCSGLWEAGGSWGNSFPTLRELASERGSKEKRIGREVS